MRRAFVLAFALAVPMSAAAQIRPDPPPAAQPPSPQLRARADDVVTILQGQGDPTAIFAPAFLAQVPAAQLTTIAQSVASQYGAIQDVERIDATGPNQATVRIGTARAVLNAQLMLEPQAPHRIAGLLVTNAEMRADSIGALVAELRALPGNVAFTVADLGSGAPALTSSLDPDRPMAIGSAFKLVILAELSRQIQAGRRRWSDVVTIDRRSLPTGALHLWPQGAPVTLHTLATMMISISDNSASDILLHMLGRDAVEAMMERAGWSTAARNRPFLTTIEMFALKSGPAEQLAAWRAGDEAARRRILAGPLAAVRAEQIDLTRFGAGPNAIDSVEWFASPADMVRIMDWLHNHGDETARAILAVNSGLNPVTAQGLAYVGYKGGSEPGVISMTFLLRTHQGRWRVVTGSWNNPASTVDEQRFGTLMARAVHLSR